MTEAPVTPVTPGDNQPTTPTPGATDPKQQPGSGGSGEFDPSSLSDEQIQKVLEDQRLWKTPRLVDLRTKAKQADELEKTRVADEQKRLAEQGKFKELADTHEQSAKAWQEKYTNSVTDNAILVEASKAGITDIDAAKKLIDRSNISLDENGNVMGVTEAVASLVKEKTYLVGGAPQPTVGAGTSPTNVNGGQFKLSQIQDPVFYEQNRAAIQVALATPGAIIDDLG